MKEIASGGALVDPPIGPLGGHEEQQVVPAKTEVLNSKGEEMIAPAYTGPLGG